MSELPNECRAFAGLCADAGLDIAVAFDAHRYNRATPAAQALPEVRKDAALALLIGNTRALWPALRAALRQDPTLAREADPLDTYVVQVIERALPTLPAPARVLYAHVTEPRVIPIQRVAEASGFAVISPSHLSVHPSYGPWFALRAVVLVDLPAPSLEPLPAPNPCAACSKPCLPALHVALTAAKAGGVPLERAVREHFRLWEQVREVCPEGRSFRYSDAQLHYHYTKERLHLFASGDES